MSFRIGHSFLFGTGHDDISHSVPLVGIATV